MTGQPSIFIVTLTGGIGSGKSTVAGLFQALGVPVIDADIVAREVVEPGQPAYDEIVAAFGNEVLQANGSLDRGKLRQIIFQAPEKRRLLESILHPRIRAEMAAQARALTAPYCIFVIPLLVETGQHAQARHILVVDSPEALQRQRVKARDNASNSEIEAILRAQVSREERLSHAREVIENSGDMEALSARVQALHNHYLALAAADATP